MPNVDINKLRQIEALEHVPDDQLQWLIDAGTYTELAPGDLLVKAGDKFASTFIIFEGKLKFVIRQGNTQRELASLEGGGITGYLPFSRGKVSLGDAVCIKPTTLLVIPAIEVRSIVTTHYELTEALVHVMTTRVRSFTEQQQQNEKMYALGKLSAGLAHELNNPAAAIISNTSYLHNQLKHLPELFKQVALMCPEERQLDQLKDLLTIIAQRPSASLTLMEKGDLEDEFTDWLKDHDVDDSYLAEGMVEEGIIISDLQQISRVVPKEFLSASLKYICYVLSINRIVNDVGQSAQRISSLVGAVKSYSHMDRGGDRQLVDIHAGIESVLTMLTHKLKDSGVNVNKQFSTSMPAIMGLAGELNQVWTNIIDNAIDAMSDTKGGILNISTDNDERCIHIVITDNGPGIPEDTLGHIFDPFFTTKPIGKGTGLGLDVVMRIVDQHNGKVQVTSVPGKTTFTITLPINNPNS